MAEKPAKACQNGRGIWLYDAGIRQGSSDFFYFSDDYKILALRYSKPSPLNGPLQRIQTSFCSADSTLLSSPQRLQQLVHGFPAAIRRLSLMRTLYKRATFLSLMQGSPAHRWQTRQVHFMLGGRPRWNSAHRDGMSPLLWYESLLSALVAHFLFREQPSPSRPPAFFLPGICEGKAAGQRISALRDEWAFAGCKSANLSLPTERCIPGFGMVSPRGSVPVATWMNVLARAPSGP